MRDSARIFHEITAGSYPFLWAPPEPPARDSIAVILIDDAVLARRHSQWPLPHDQWVHALRNLLKASPAAVFVDILFLSNPPSGDTGDSESVLRQLVTEANRRGIPLVFADADATAPDQRAAVRAILGSDSRLAPISWSESKESNLYPLSRSADRTPAASLYAEVCGGSEVAPFCPERHRQLSALMAEDPPPIYVDWAQSFADEEGVADRVRESVLHTHSSILTSYHRTFAFDRLLEATPAGTQSPREIFGGKVVFVGAALAGIPDTIALPIGGRLPGVYMHAMAFDNLLTYADRYKRRVKPNFLGFHVELWGFLVLPVYLACLPLIAALATRAGTCFEAYRAAHHERGNDGPRRASGDADDATWLVHNFTALALRLGLACGVLAMATIPYRLGAAPPDLIGVLLAAEISQQATRILRAGLSIITEVIAPIAATTLPSVKRQGGGD